MCSSDLKAAAEGDVAHAPEVLRCLHGVFFALLMEKTCLQSARRREKRGSGQFAAPDFPQPQLPSSPVGAFISTRCAFMLLKVKADEETRSQIVQIANIYRGNILDVSPKSVVIELTGDIEKLRGFVNMMENYGVLEMAKTGVLAMSRGEKM